MTETVELNAEWIRNTAMDVMLATEVEEAIRILTVALTRSVGTMGKAMGWWPWP